MQLWNWALGDVNSLPSSVATVLFVWPRCRVFSRAVATSKAAVFWRYVRSEVIDHAERRDGTFTCTSPRRTNPPCRRSAVTRFHRGKCALVLRRGSKLIAAGFLLLLFLPLWTKCDKVVMRPGWRLRVMRPLTDEDTHSVLSVRQSAYLR